METLKAIKTRSSIRNYTDQDISKENIEELLKCAMAAPSAKNHQPWEFVVIKDKNVLAKIPEISTFTTMMPRANTGILVCADMNRKYKELWSQDCSAATQNILLAAHDMGIGTVWTGIYPKEGIISNFTEFFDLPENIIPFCMIALGYPKQENRPKDKFDENKIHWERFD